MAIRFLEEDTPKKKSQIKFTDPEDTPQDPTFGESLSAALQQAKQQTPLASQAGFAVEKGIRRAFDVAGEAIAETPQGVVPQAIPGTPFQTLRLAPEDPNAIRVPAGIAGPTAGLVANIPDIASAFAGQGILGAGRQALARNLTSRGIGAQIGKVESLAGVAKRNVSTRQLKEFLGTKQGNFTDVVNKVDELLTAGTKLPKQFLSDFRVALKKALNTPAFNRGEPQALLLKTQDKADEAFNALIPGRAKLSKRFAGAKSRERLLKSLGGAVTTGAKVAIGGSIAAGLINAFR